MGNSVKIEYKRNRCVRDPQYKSFLASLVRNARARSRQTIIAAYGGKCNCCDEDQYEFLCIDHVFGGGSAERKIIKSGYLLCLLIIRLNFPPEYQILCHNCNYAKAALGLCPHQDVVFDRMDLECLIH